MRTPTTDQAIRLARALVAQADATPSAISPDGRFTDWTAGETVITLDREAASVRVFAPRAWARIVWEADGPRITYLGAADPLALAAVRLVDELREEAAS